MTASDTVLRDYVPDQSGGGDALRLQQVAVVVTPSVVRPALGLDLVLSRVPAR